MAYRQQCSICGKSPTVGMGMSKQSAVKPCKTCGTVRCLKCSRGIVCLKCAPAIPDQTLRDKVINNTEYQGLLRCVQGFWGCTGTIMVVSAMRGGFAIGIILFAFGSLLYLLAAIPQWVRNSKIKPYVPEIMRQFQVQPVSFGLPPAPGAPTAQYPPATGNYFNTTPATQTTSPTPPSTSFPVQQPISFSTPVVPQTGGALRQPDSQELKKLKKNFMWVGILLIPFLLLELVPYVALIFPINNIHGILYWVLPADFLLIGIILLTNIKIAPQTKVKVTSVGFFLCMLIYGFSQYWYQSTGNLTASSELLDWIVYMSGLAVFLLIVALIKKALQVALETQSSHVKTKLAGVGAVLYIVVLSIRLVETLLGFLQYLGLSDFTLSDIPGVYSWVVLGTMFFRILGAVFLMLGVFIAAKPGNRIPTDFNLGSEMGNFQPGTNYPATDYHANVIFCVECGHGNPFDSDFCTECGAKIVH